MAPLVAIIFTILCQALPVNSDGLRSNVYSAGGFSEKKLVTEDPLSSSPTTINPTAPPSAIKSNSPLPTFLNELLEEKIDVEGGGISSSAPTPSLTSTPGESPQRPPPNGTLDSDGGAIAPHAVSTTSPYASCHMSPLPSVQAAKKWEKVMSFYAFGDTPYDKKERYCLNHQLRKLDMTSPNGPSFIMHIGDIRRGGVGECNAEAYNDVVEIFTHPDNALKYDARDCFFVVGDNEWTDCENRSDAWRLWMDHFGPKSPSGFGTFSSRNLTIERQTKTQRLPGVDRSENFAFYQDRVLFLGLNIVGGRMVGDEAVRLTQNMDFLKAKFTKYSRKPYKMKAAVVFGHAQLNGPRKLRFGAPFQRYLATTFPDLPVMYLHGNDHNFCARYLTEFNATNLVDVEVQGGGNAPPLLVSVVKTPKDGKFTFTIDQRGGLYGGDGEACPRILQETWITPRISYPDPPKPVLPSPDLSNSSTPWEFCDVGYLPAFDRSIKTETVVSFIAMEGIPQTTKERFCLNKHLRDLNLESKNTPSFMMHLGNIKNSTSPCDSEAYNDVAEIFSNPKNAKNYNPVQCLFVPGEHDISACVNSDEAWGHWIETFGPNNMYGFGNLSPDKEFKRQVDDTRLSPAGRVDNFVFSIKNVLFIGLNLAEQTDNRDNALHHRQNYGWIRSNVKLYAERETPLKALVIFGHAQIDIGATRREVGGRLKNLLAEEYKNLPVMYVHGDRNRFCARYVTEFDNNFVDLEVNDGNKAPPIKVSIVRNPKDDTHIFKIDQRGGPYGKGQNCPRVTQRTWTSGDTPTTPTPRPTPIPTLFPTQGGVDPPPLPEYEIRAKNPPHVAYPLGQCQGDCDNDEECEGELVCIQRDGGELIPGCVGQPEGQRDYCGKPQNNGLPELDIVAKNAPDEAYPLDECKGDCDSDEECKEGLVCMQRKNEPVPGCYGDPKPLKDYCVKANLVPPSPTPSPRPTVSPTSSESDALPEVDIVVKNAPHPNLPLDECKGDCDHDGECKKGLICMQRKGSEPVPGCRGEPKFKKDYCIKPPQLDVVARNEPHSAFPLRECQADCDADLECAEGLVCFQREGDEDVPGCQGMPQFDMDYCIKEENAPPAPTPAPKAVPPQPLVLLAKRPPHPAYPLGQCQGDCSNDNECKEGYYCYKRKGFRQVPGCTGKGDKDRDYCIRIEANTTRAPTPVPTPVPRASSLPALDLVTKRPPHPSYPQGLGQCQGDCNMDNDCQDGHYCFQRKRYEPVPGCSGRGEKERDYCTSVYPQLAVVARIHPSKAYPLKECQADCNNNKECDRGLRCFYRVGNEPVPGCRGKAEFGKDYCVQKETPAAPPKDAPDPTPIPTPKKKNKLPVLKLATTQKPPHPAYPLAKCEGDCDKNSDCAPGLSCMLRVANEPVPGCRGTAIAKKDYCIDKADGQHNVFRLQSLNEK